MSDKKVSLEELLYYIFFSILLVAKGIGLIDGQKLFNIAIVMAFIFFLAKMCITRYTLPEGIIIGILFLLSITAYFSSKEKGILFAAMVVLGMKNVDIKRVFRLGLCIWCCTFFGTILIHLAGFSNDLIFAHRKLGLGHILRYSLGFPHPNVLQISYVTLMAFVLYVWQPRGKKSLLVTLGLFIGSCYIFVYSISFTGMLLTVFYLICRCYFVMRKELTKLEKVLIQAILPVCAVFSLIGPLVIQGKLFDLINKALNTRYNLSRFFLTHSPITLFGAPLIETPPEDHYNVDCSYVYCFLLYGVILFAIYMIGYFFLVRDCVKKNKREELAMLVGFLVAGVSEPFVFNSSFKNLTFIFLGSFLYSVLSRFQEKQASAVAQKEIFSCEKIENQVNYLKSIVVQIPEKLLYKFAISAVSIGILLTVVFSVMNVKTFPSKIYMPLSLCDTTGGEKFYFDSNNLPEDFDGWMPQYYDIETPMYEFDGNMITVELVRDGVSCMLWSTTLIFAGELLGYLVVKRKKILD